jgi:hypothetical protein
MPRASSAAGGDGRWTTLWRGVIQPRCASCHASSAARAVLDFHDEDSAYKAALEHVVPRSPEKSELFARIAPECRPPVCTPMPMKGAPLDESSRALVRRWIERGAPRD